MEREDEDQTASSGAVEVLCEERLFESEISLAAPRHSTASHLLFPPGEGCLARACTTAGAF